MLGQRRRLRVNFTDLVLVFNVEVDVPLPVDLRELRLASHRNSRCVDLSGLGVEHRRIVAAAIEGQHAVGRGFIDDGIGIGTGLDLAEYRKRLQIENRDIVVHAVAGKTAAQIICDGDAVDAVGPRNGPNHLVGRGVDDFRLCGV
jgi:hypothetical protein